MDDVDPSATMRPVNADDFQQGWLAGWLSAHGHDGTVREAQFIEAVRAWQLWLAANGANPR